MYKGVQLYIVNKYSFQYLKRSSMFIADISAVIIALLFANALFIMLNTVLH